MDAAIEMLFALGGIMAATGGSLWLALRGHSAAEKKRHDALVAAWRPIAEARGLQLSVSGRVRLRGAVHGVPIVVDTFDVEGTDEQTYTRVAATASERRPRIIVRPGHGGGAALPTGDAGFDATWAVESASPDAARRVIGEAVRAAFGELGRRLPEGRDPVLTVEDRRVRLQFREAVAEAEMLGPAIDAVVAACRGAGAPYR